MKARPAKTTATQAGAQMTGAIFRCGAKVVEGGNTVFKVYPSAFVRFVEEFSKANQVAPLQEGRGFSDPIRFTDHVKSSPINTFGKFGFGLGKGFQGHFAKRIDAKKPGSFLARGSPFVVFAIDQRMLFPAGGDDKRCGGGKGDGLHLHRSEIEKHQMSFCGM